MNPQAQNSAPTPGTDVVTAPLPVAFEALLAKLTELADERGIKLGEVEEKDELSGAAHSLLTRAERDQIINTEVERIANEVLEEKVASGEWTLTDGIIRKRQTSDTAR